MKTLREALLEDASGVDWDYYARMAAEWLPPRANRHHSGEMGFAASDLAAELVFKCGDTAISDAESASPKSPELLAACARVIKDESVDATPEELASFTANVMSRTGEFSDGTYAGDDEDEEEYH